MGAGKEKAQGQQAQTVPVVLMQQSMGEDDEINLLDLWRILLRRKGIILIVAGLVVAAGFAYVLLAAPVYKAESFLLPPTEKNVQALNVQVLNQQVLDKQVFNVQLYTPEKVYNMFIQHLKSRALRRRYFDTHKLIDSMVPDHNSGTPVEQIFENFNKELSVSRVKKDKSFVQVAFEGANAKLAAKWVNGFVSQANAATVNTLVQNVTGQLESRKRTLREQIAAKRKSAGLIRMDRLAKLEEAIHIAEKLGLKGNGILSLMAGKSTVALNQTNIPLYMSGSRALRAEAESLRARKNNDPFIQGLRGLQEKLDALKSVHIDPSRISAMRVDQPAFIPNHRIKPKRKLIILLALFGGLMLGVFAAFFAEFLDKVRQEQQEAG